MSRSAYLEELSYLPDSCELFERVRDLPGAALLDSSFPASTQGRFDILTACPVNPGCTLESDASEAECAAYYEALRTFHHDYYGEVQPVAQDIPFCGGLLGYLGYDSGNGLQKVAGVSGEAAQTPAVNLGAYDWCVIQDHLLKRAVLVMLPSITPALRRDLLQRMRSPRRGRGNEFSLTSRFTSNMDQDDYRQAFDKIQAYIHAGDCYQVNLAQRFTASYSGDPWHAYRLLRAQAAAPYSGFISLGGNDAVISLSPERFIALHGSHVEAAPIKGTRPRYQDPQADLMASRELLASSKDRAENLMIVDLLRNDLGRSCTPGSIHVDRLFELQSFPTVHHLVSTISGELRADRSAIELLRDCYPGGSITGAPKRRAMEVIAELEPHPRQVYCGSLLYISADGRMDSNIAIRTLVCHQQQLHCWGGGGVVADSQWLQEYQETYDKVGKFLQLLEESFLTV